MSLEDAVSGGINKAKKAFTLVELLVVTSVIAILAGLLLPALAKSREGARETTMTNNARQIMVASQQYGNDYDKQELPICPTVAKPKWGNSEEMAIPVLLKYGYLGGKKTETPQQIIDSIANLTNFDTDGKVNILSEGSVVVNDKVIQDIFYDSSNPGKTSGPVTVKYGPFGPNRGSIWTHYDGNMAQASRIQQDVLMSIGWRGKDKKWDTSPFGSATGYDGINDSIWIYTKNGGWKPLKNEIVKN